jgi:hypothetical protein
MPSHTVQSALIKFYYNNGAPWNWTTWKDITGIHDGIFPTDDALLPKGFTRQNVTDIKSYFDQYQAQPTEDAKIKFAGQNKGNPLPGRVKWREWVTTNWKVWKIHIRITDVLTAEGLHPLNIMANDARGEKMWPNAETYIPLVVDAVALDLFGDESFDSSGRLAFQYRSVTQNLVQRVWGNVYKQSVRSRNRLGALEDAATRAFRGEGSFIC